MSSDERRADEKVPPEKHPDLRETQRQFWLVLNEVLGFGHSAALIGAEGVRALSRPERISGNLGITATDAHGVKRSTMAYAVFDALDNYEKWQHYLLELVHNRVVSEWFLFLEQLFAHFLAKHVDGVRLNTELERRVQAAKKKGKTNAEVVDAFRRFENAPTKHATIQQIAGTRVHDWIMARVEKHILMRNTWEHDGGVLRQEVLDFNKVECVSVQTPEGNTREFRAGDRLSIGVWETNTMAQAFTAAASQISGAWMTPVEEEPRDT